MMKFPGSKFESQPKSRELIIMHKLEERIASRRDVVNLEVEACQLSPNLSLKYSCNHLHRQHNFATFIFVQFNLFVVPVQGRQPPLPIAHDGSHQVCPDFSR